MPTWGSTRCGRCPAGSSISPRPPPRSPGSSPLRVSTRLTESAACLIASDTGLDRQLARILAETGQKRLLGKPVLEINAKHPAVIALAASLRDKGREGAADGMYLLLDLARVADGETPLDPAAFTRRLGALLAKGV